MAIETVLFGKRAVVKSVEDLKLFQRKQDLVAAATAMRAQPENPVFHDIMSKIIRINRTIRARGAFVQYME